MAYFLKIMSVMVAVLAVIVLVLSVLFFLVLEINSNFFPPEVVEIIYKIEITKDVPGLLTQENIGTYLEVLTGIVALLFPVSLQIVADAKGDLFSSQETTSVVFDHWTFKCLKLILVFLLLLTIISFFYNLPDWVLFIVMLFMSLTFVVVYFYFKHLQTVIRSFPELVSGIEKKRIDKILRDG